MRRSWCFFFMKSVIWLSSFFSDLNNSMEIITKELGDMNLFLFFFFTCTNKRSLIDGKERREKESEAFFFLLIRWQEGHLGSRRRLKAFVWLLFPSKRGNNVKTTTTTYCWESSCCWVCLFIGLVTIDNSTDFSFFNSFKRSPVSLHRADNCDWITGAA